MTRAVSLPPSLQLHSPALRSTPTLGLVTSLLASSLLFGCTRPAAHSAIEVAMTSAYRPTSDAPLLGAHLDMPGGDVVLAGDMHCHVSPPDHPQEASRGPEETARLAREEDLDFVVLTPHVPALFFEDEGLRSAVLAGQSELKRAMDAASNGRTLFIVGMEYTDHGYGHVGASFADLAGVLADVSAEEAHLHPGRFFERFVARGGVLVINHPLSTPLDSSFSMARADLSWRPFTTDAPVPDEIATVTRLAQGMEAYNMVVTHLRDRYLVGDTSRSIVATLTRIDQEIATQHRRIAPVGGTDSHVSYLRSTTFVRAKERSTPAIRDAIVAGRTCIRAPEACSFEVRSPGGEWQSIGASLPAQTAVEARATGGDVQILVNGREAATAKSGETTHLTLSDKQCQIVRARVGEGYSAPVYVGCSF